MTEPALTRAQEWRRFGMVPVAGALGYACSVIHIYGLGPYFEPIGAEFGWSRTEITYGLTISTLLQALLAVPIGMAVDRFGPRRIALIGVPLTGVAIGLIGTATGTTANWLMLWLLVACAVLGVQATVWASAVASRFSASRGLALAIMLCGASVAAALFPWMATELIAAKGWRAAIAWQGGIWTAITFPMVVLFFRSAVDDGRRAGTTEKPRVLGGVTFAEGLRSAIYIRLLLASLLFTFIVLGLVVHFVPILTDSGMDKVAAAGIAGLVGLASLAGRLGTGLLLDHFRGSLVGAAVFLLPVLGCLLLLLAGTSPLGAAAAALLIGLTLGAEVDVIVYLTTRYFGLASFGALYGGILTALSIGTALGPLGASAVYDSTGNYAGFLWIAVGAMGLAALLLASLPRPPAAGAHGH